jgi:uncharacterized protein (DUF952 family)
MVVAAAVAAHASLTERAAVTAAAYSMNQTGEEIIMIYHITTPAAWQEAQGAGQYSDPSLEKEGFIHFSTADQLLIPANGMFRGREDLILLCVDEKELHGRLIFEDCYASGMDFPHLYAPLNLDAVRDVIDFPANPDGSFSLPMGVG